MPSVVCSCGKTIETRPEWAGSYIRCGGCASKLYVPHAGTVAEPPPPAAAESDQRPCPYCAEPIRREAIKCRWCGQSLGAPVRPAAAAAPRADTGGTGILIVGILGWVLGCFGMILSPVAWAMGATHESSCRARGIEPSGAAKAGKILGIIGTVFYGIIALLMILGAAVGGVK